MIARIKTTVRIEDLAERLGMEFNRSHFAHCPIHGEKTASLKIYTDSDSWHCFGCGRGGDAIDLVQGVLGLDFNSAVSYLCDAYGLGQRRLSRHDRARIRAEQNRRKRERDRQKQIKSAEHDAYCELARLENIRDTSEPGGTDWVDAIQRIDLAEYRWREAQEIARQRRTGAADMGLQRDDGR